MQLKYPNLFKPLQVGNTTFKNRIVAGALGCNQENPGTELIQANVDYYGAIARGGAARVVAGGDSVVNKDAGYAGGMGRMKLYLDPYPMTLHMSLRNYANTMHQYSCLAFVQLTHNGGPTGPGPMGPQVGKGVSNLELPDGSCSIEMTAAELEQIADDFAKCAARVKDAGLDGCIIHAGHGKLLDQFRASDFNRRTDEFGGSVANRARFPLMVLRKIRDAVGPDFLLEYRTSVHEHEPGGIKLEESIEFFKILEAERLVDLFHVTAGRHFNPKSNAYCISPATFPAAPNREYCVRIKEAGISTPLVIINSCADPDVAEELIASGTADLVCLSRQLNLADPYYPRKLHEGRPELVDGCLRCHGCYDVVGPCSVNPHASYKIYEASYPLKKAPVARKVCVVGGGIAGLKAAYTAAERGHQVILFEKEEQLGGQLIFSDTDTYKIDIRRYKNNMVKRVLDHPGIEVRLGCAVTPETVEKEAPYAVIACVGAKTRVPDIPGVQKPNVLSVLDAYRHPERLGSRVILVGSGLTACETGLHLRRTEKQVTIVGRRERICYHERFDKLPTALYSPIPTFLEWFEEQGIAVHNDCEVVEILDDGVIVRDRITGQERTIAGDTVVLASGMAARSGEAEVFRDTAPYFAAAGDCIRPKKIREAVSTAYWAVMEI